MARCKACGAPIVWIALKNGKMHPVDEEKVYYKQDGGKDRIVTRDGSVVAGTIVTPPDDEALKVGYSSHFATCPFADEFRRSKHE